MNDSPQSHFHPGWLICPVCLKVVKARTTALLRAADKVRPVRHVPEHGQRTCDGTYGALDASVTVSDPLLLTQPTNQEEGTR